MGSVDWTRVRRWIPSVRRPLFYATTKSKAAYIVRYGLKSSGPSQVGISTFRDLPFVLEGHFGNWVIVLDEEDLAKRYQLREVGYPDFPAEMETRVVAKSLEPHWVQGLIYNGRLPKPDHKTLANAPFPVVHKESNKWVPLGPRDTRLSSYLKSLKRKH